MRHPHLIEILDSISFFGGDDIILYGSQVRGDATPKSDIDLMAFDQEVYAHVTSFIKPMEAAYNASISWQWGNKEEFNNSKSAFWRSLRKEAMYIQDFIKQCDAQEGNKING